ncbi:MAG: NHL repeat-containing protein [Pseudomonadota bacterium]
MMKRYWLVFLLVGCVGSLAAQELRIGEIAPLRQLSAAGGTPLALPSDVAVAANGRVYVVDGGNHRLVIYDALGGLVAAVGQYGSGHGQFAEPLGVAVDRAGLAYVADAGNHRIQVLDGEGKFLRTLPLMDGDKPVRPADVAVSEQSGNLFVTGNNTHRVLKLSPQGEVLASWGGEGVAQGQFRYPATLAVREGMVAVVDVLNTRVQIFDEDGRYHYQLGEWGVLPGQLFRPKGIAIDQAGRYYISDSYMEVVQVFDGGYQLLHVLGMRGNPYRFVSPVGLAVGLDERLYVTEMLGNRVSVFELR